MTTHWDYLKILSMFLQLNHDIDAVKAVIIF